MLSDLSWTWEEGEIVKGKHSDFTADRKDNAV